MVPAIDEDAGVAATVANLMALDYPASLRRVLVVADGRSDAIAERAREAGATVIEQNDRGLRGKGRALATAIERCDADGFADALLVVDPGTVSSQNLLRALASQLDTGASAIQVGCAVLDPDASWRARLMAIASCLFHRVRSLGRDRLGGSVALRGSGMCFTMELMRKVPSAGILGSEDAEYGIRLGLAGFRVRYCDEAVIGGYASNDERTSRSQRRACQGSRRLPRRTRVTALLREAARCHNRVLFDLLIEVMMPRLGAIVFSAGCGLLLSIGFSALVGHMMYAVYAWALCATFLAVYIGRGVWLTGLGLRGFITLMGAPLYLAWQAASLVLHGGGRRGWVGGPPDVSAAP